MVLRHTPAKSRGFSLLELIIVLVIIGVIVAAISISITDTRQDNLRLEARRLAARLSLAVDEAILTNQEFGLVVETDSYRFLLLQEERWQAISSDEERQLREQQLPEGMEILLIVDNLFSEFQENNNISKLFQEKDEIINEDEEEPDATLRPQIYLMSSGEINPFNILIGYEDENPVFYHLQGSFDGKITLKGPVRESMSFALTRVNNNPTGDQQ